MNQLCRKLIRKFSYYQPTEILLRELGIISSFVKVIDTAGMIELSKKQSFVMQDLMRLFNCNKDTVKQIINKYFKRKYNYYYKTDLLNDNLTEGIDEFEI